MALKGCIGGISLGTSYLSDKSGPAKEKHPLNEEEKKEQVLREINSKGCYVTAGAGGGIKKKISADSSERLQLFGGLSTRKLDGESVTEITTSPSN